MTTDYKISRAAAQRMAEAQFEATLREYILDNGKNSFGDGRKYQWGGAHNFLATCESVFSKLAKEFDCADYEQVAVMMQDIVNECDLPFAHKVEQSDDGPDRHDIEAELADRRNDERKCES
jgi:hypothetical protein